MDSELQLDVRHLNQWRRHLVNAYEVKLTVWSMPERFKVLCIPCKALYKCSALPLNYLYRSFLVNNGFQSTYPTSGVVIMQVRCGALVLATSFGGGPPCVAEWPRKLGTECHVIGTAAPFEPIHAIATFGRHRRGWWPAAAALGRGAGAACFCDRL